MNRSDEFKRAVIDAKSAALQGINTIGRKLDAIPGVLSMRWERGDAAGARVRVRYDTSALRAAVGAVMGNRPHEIVVAAMSQQQAAELDATIREVLRASERAVREARGKRDGWGLTGLQLRRQAS